MVDIEMVHHIVDGGPPAGQYHATEMENILRGIRGCGVKSSSVTATITGASRVITIPAFDYVAPEDGSLDNNVECSYAGGTVTPDAGGSDPRVDIVVAYDDNTVAVIEGVETALSATVVEPPEPDLPDNAILLFKVPVAAGQGSFTTEALIYGRAVYVAPAVVPISDAAKSFIEGGAYASFSYLGAPPSDATVVDGDIVGLGWQVVIAGTYADVQFSTVEVGAWRHECTSGGSGGDAGFVGPYVTAAKDWAIRWRGKFANNAAERGFVGAKSSRNNFDDENGLISLRKSGTGNVFLVCDNGGTETTVDLGVDGSAVASYGIVVSGGGASVQAYVNGAPVGSPITTNIPTGGLYLMCGHSNASSTAIDMFTYDLSSRIEAA